MHLFVLSFHSFLIGYTIDLFIGYVLYNIIKQPITDDCRSSQRVDLRDQA